MTDREKMIELLRDVQYLGGLEEKIADHLLANGVTIGKKERFLFTERGDVIPLDRRWIPMTERLPEDGGTYVATAYDGHAKRVTFVKWQKRLKRWELTGRMAYWKITHWMPLPEPPKGDSI